MPLHEALKKAQEAQKDLIEIAPEAKPPVVKITDFKKFKYLEEKKEKEARRHVKQIKLKEIRFTPFIGDHDLQIGLTKIKNFLKEKSLVKISIIFRGRQITHQEFGHRLLTKIISSLEGIAEKDRPERWEGKRLVTIIRPAKGSQKNIEQQVPINNETENQESSS